MGQGRIGWRWLCRLHGRQIDCELPRSARSVWTGTAHLDGTPVAVGMGGKTVSPASRVSSSCGTDVFCATAARVTGRSSVRLSRSALSVGRKKRAGHGLQRLDAIGVPPRGCSDSKRCVSAVVFIAGQHGGLRKYAARRPRVFSPKRARQSDPCGLCLVDARRAMQGLARIGRSEDRRTQARWNSSGWRLHAPLDRSSQVPRQCWITSLCVPSGPWNMYTPSGNAPTRMRSLADRNVPVCTVRPPKSNSCQAAPTYEG